MNSNLEFKKKFNQRLVKFSLDIIAFCSIIRKQGAAKPLADQLIRSGTSIGANIIEAKGCGSRKDYVRFFEIALKSAHETQYWLYLIKESSRPNSQKANRLLDECAEISKIITSGILTMKGKR